MIFKNTLFKTAKFSSILFLLSFLILGNLYTNISAQPETAAWGNITGIRVNGELMKFESSIRVVQPNLMDFSQTEKEKQRPEFNRDGSKVIIKTILENLSITEVVEETGKGTASVKVEFTTDSNITMAGAYFCIELPSDDYSDASINLIDPKPNVKKNVEDKNIPPWMRNQRVDPIPAKGVKIVSQKRNFEIDVTESIDIIVRKGNPMWGNPNTQIYFALISGNANAGQTGENTFNLKISGKIDKTPIVLTLDALKPGRVFDGVGGNFRLQSERDPEVIDYCLENLNVTWGRVEMPWANWHRDETVDPIEAARSGKNNQRVDAAMKMAQKLAKKNMPVIVSAWGAPEWAIIGSRTFGRRPDGTFGNPLNQSKMKSIVKSITSYLVYLKEAYGVEAAMFSFNESDLGIYVRQTGEEHAALIKTLGEYMASQGLATKMLVGDNSDANTYDFLTPAIEDPETHKYIGAVSFHSWRGFDNWTLSIWGDIAKELNVPLLVGEGSTDAAAHRYPDIFLEPAYALSEIDTYIRIYSICQARSVLQWQLTSDYSVMTGNGIYDTEGSLKPTQRFWNLKQIGLTPSGSFNLPVSSDNSDISCAAFGDIKNEIYSVNMVNNGGTRKVILKGVPNSVKKLRMYITDQNRGMDEAKDIKVSNGTAEFSIDAASFTTLISIE